jgi:oligoendopeptidase F
MTKTRQEVAVEDRWNIEKLYPTREDWEKDYLANTNQGQESQWPEVTAFIGKLNNGPEEVKKALETLLERQRQLSKMHTYASLRYNEDKANDVAKGDLFKATSAYHEFTQATSWFEPELLSLPDSTLKSYLSSPVLKDYVFYLEKIVNLKPHTLNKENEEILALSLKALQASRKAFGAMNDADFKFGTVVDSKGNSYNVTHGQYAVSIRDQDRVLRENIFKKYHGTFIDFENTLCELLAGQVSNDIFMARARKFNSSLESALKPNNIDTSVYHSLINAVTKRINSLHRYNKLRKKILKLDTQYNYDLQVPLTPSLDIKMSYKEAEQAIIESVAPLGKDYQKTLADGLLKERWVDRFENKNKHSGAFSGGCYDSMPYILMNYKSLMRDVFTLAHEAGHSMHTKLSKSQPYQYYDYPIFVAEVASTFNEELLSQYLLKKYTGKNEQIFLINQKIEDIRGTLFRQTMFAEFELLIHEMGEKNIPLTPSALRQEYAKLNSKYMGPDVEFAPEASIEWARIPHFYANFYVYQYATGISAALALAQKVTQGGEKERNDYLTFLKSGSSKYPIDLLKVAGVDMKTSAPVEAAIDRFDQLVTQLEKLLES